MMKPTVDMLFSRIRQARYCVAFTGAGISTLSGLPDFRGERGLYAGEPAFSRTAYGEKLFDIAAFEEDPAFFYRNAGAFIYPADEKIPSAVHRSLAEMEAQGLIKAVITQNFDSLHQKAGSRRVIELHGSPRTHYCLRCSGIRMGYEEAAALVKAGDMPRCPHCNRALKPAITFFGEGLPLEARREAEAEAQQADVMLILGTSLSVYPAADLPRTTLRNGGQLIIINNQETPLDANAALRFEDLETVFNR
ncbi:MAG: NAD-dependent deacetylase [Treponema sp.]|jgi:NAD-dependent deacetylase|nr:NAD-dependent deacetylase [Treponema sp.]